MFLMTQDKNSNVEEKIRYFALTKAQLIKLKIKKKMFFFKERINIFFYVVFEGIGARALLAVEVLVEEENFIEHHLRGPMLAMKMGGHFSIQKESMVSSGYFPLTAQASIRPYLDT